MKSLFSVICTVLFAYSSFAQAIAVGGGNGATVQWDGTSWSTGSQPTSANTGIWTNGSNAGTIQLAGSNLNGGPCVDGSLSAVNGFKCGEIGSFTNGKNGGVINISAGRIKIYGDYSITNTFTLQLSNNAIFEITGDITLSNNADFQFGANCDGCKLIANRFSADNGTTLNVTGGGAVDIATDFLVGTGATVTIDGSSEMTVGGDFTVGGGTVNVVGCDPDCDGQLTIGGTVSDGGSITGGGTVIILTDPNYTCPIGTTCLDGQGYPLPITLKEFSAKVVNNRVFLKWSTLSEENFDYFEVQRVTSDGVFSVLCTQQGNGWSTEERNYTWTDENPNFGLNYYRLESVDYNGYRETFPSIVALYEPQDWNLKFGPNPVNANTPLFLINGRGESFSLKIVSIDGSVIFETDKVDSEILLPEDINPGVYIALFNLNGLLKTQRLIVK
ncbi:MAG: hypothetical protein ACI8WP_000733 [Flavobacteriaceae bacterium]|jgi:hypothetical protein